MTAKINNYFPINNNLTTLRQYERSSLTIVIAANIYLALDTRHNSKYFAILIHLMLPLHDGKMVIPHFTN